MTCLVPNCQHPQSRDNLCRWHRNRPPELATTEIGMERRCYRCGEFWPTDPSPDLSGKNVRFWMYGEARCYACVLDLNMARMGRRVAAA